MPKSSLPFVRTLPSDFSIEEVFPHFAQLPRCIWLDSASPGPKAVSGESLGRYSFLTADPAETIDANVGASDPWPQLDGWCRSLPSTHDPGLPPFQGGIAGLWGYESATWLEPIPTARHCDIRTPAMSLGLYDWVIATDHQLGRSWLVCSGIGAVDTDACNGLATSRADWVHEALKGKLPNDDSLVSTGRTGEPPCVDLSVTDGQHPTSASGIVSNFTSSAFQQSVDEIVELIHRGDSFQVNFAQRLLARESSSASELYLRLREQNPAPFGGFYDGGYFQVLSSSPEGFLQVRGDRVVTRPIKGTVRRTGDVATDRRLGQELLASEKDRAENVMIVDLLRNDLSRVCKDDSVVVRQLCALERYEYVQHLVSVVEGQLEGGKSVVDLLRACFPGGSVTGAPKIEAMKTIARLEPHHRGPYCGSLGYIGSGAADFNILIRTITAACGFWQIPVGGGITARSNAISEEAETWAKAEGMLRALRSSDPG